MGEAAPDGKHVLLENLLDVYEGALAGAEAEVLEGGNRDFKQCAGINRVHREYPWRGYPTRRVSCTPAGSPSPSTLTT